MIGGVGLALGLTGVGVLLWREYKKRQSAKNVLSPLANVTLYGIPLKPTEYGIDFKTKKAFLTINPISFTVLPTNGNVQSSTFPDYLMPTSKMVKIFTAADGTIKHPQIDKNSFVFRFYPAEGGKTTFWFNTSSNNADGSANTTHMQPVSAGTFEITKPIKMLWSIA